MGTQTIDEMRDDADIGASIEDEAFSGSIRKSVVRLKQDYIKQVFKDKVKAMMIDVNLF